MVFSKRDFGEELKAMISSGKNARQIGKWAHSIFFNYCRELNPELREIIETLLMMEEGPEFEYTEQELRLLAELLVNNEKDPFKKIDDLKFK